MCDGEAPGVMIHVIDCHCWAFVFWTCVKIANSLSYGAPRVAIHVTVGTFGPSSSGRLVGAVREIVVTVGHLHVTKANRHTRGVPGFRIREIVF